MAFKDIIELFPYDIFIHQANIQIIREMQKIDLSKVTKPVYITLNTFDTLEFPYNKFKKTGIVTAINAPKMFQKSNKIGGPWSVYYDDYVKINELDFYHQKMEKIKWSLYHYIENFYNPLLEIDTNLSLLKTIKDLLDYNDIEYFFVKPQKIDWYDASDNDFMYTASEEVNNYLKKHELYYILQTNNILTRKQFKNRFKEEYEEHKIACHVFE